MGAIQSYIKDLLWVLSLGAQTAFNSTLYVKDKLFNFYKKSLVWSLYVAGIVLILLLIGEITRLALLNSLIVLIIAIWISFWLVILWPVFHIVKLLETFDPLRMLFGKIAAILLTAATLAIYAFLVPSGTSGITHLLLSFLIIAGSALVGITVTTRTFGANLLVLAVIFSVSMYLPSVSKQLPFLTSIADRNAADAIVPNATELRIDLDSLNQGTADRLFLNGEPLWWCRSAPDAPSQYKCFNQPGFDQLTNQPLYPISEFIVANMRENLVTAREQEDQASEQREREVEVSAARAQAAAAQSLLEASELAALEAEKQRVAEAAAYIKKYIIGLNAHSTVSLTINLNGVLDYEMSQGLVNGNYNGNILTQQAVSDGVFDRLYNGDTQEIEKLGLLQGAGRMLLIKVQSAQEQNVASTQLINVRLQAESRLLTFSNGSVSFLAAQQVMAPGFSPEKALSQAKDMLRLELLPTIQNN